MRKTLLVCGAASSLLYALMIGLWERINISVFLLWAATLAAVLWRTGTAKGEKRHVAVGGTS